MTVFGLDIGGTTIQYGTGGPQGLERCGQVPTLAQQGGEALIGRIAQIIEQNLGDARAIGVSTAGQVDALAGVVTHATDSLPGWTGMPIGPRLQERFDMPVAVENDVNAAALGEMAFGAMQGIDSFLALMYGTGVGGAVVEKGSIYRGALGNAAEFGHLVTHATDGEACQCGGRGCYEAYASTRALSLRMKELGLPGGPKELFAARDEASVALIEQWLQEVAAGLASLCYAFHPRYIMLGGGVMQQPRLAPRLQETLRARLMPNFAKVELVPAQEPQLSGLKGAVHLALEAARGAGL